MDFANTLKNLRDMHDITQEELAEYLKVSRPTVAGYETKNRQPDFEKLEKIAEFFQVSIDYLVTGEEAVDKSELLEAMVDQKVYSEYKKLSLYSKKEVLKLIQLLKLKESKK